ncbi:hypothetical protein [Vulcanisaeta thermophila]|uniref:hypothetical protein n=1 Tax=Vulcanisaeta thermophila TaxID=867917 RepID=UPI000853CCAA|nr:hypothetical protein [Vulcanisaeta thermophila]
MAVQLYARVRTAIILTLTVALAVMVTVITTATTHTGVKPTYPPTTQQSITQPSDVSIIVIGPPTFVEYIDKAIPTAESLSLSSIQESPADSVFIVDWNYLVSQVGMNGALSDLSFLFRRGDLVVVYSNNSFLAAYELGRAWALANGVNFTAVPAGSGGVFVAAFGNPKHLIYTSFNKPTELSGIITKYLELEQAWQSIGQITEPTYTLSPIAPSLQPVGTTNLNPCYQYEIEPPSNSIIINYLPEYNNAFSAAYSDGNGTFYYDTCIFIYNGIFYTADGTPYMYVIPTVWIAYVPSSNMVNNGGFINYYVGTIDHEIGYYDYEAGTTNSHIDYAGYYSPGSTLGKYLSSFNVTFWISPSGPFIITYMETPLLVSVYYKNTGGTQPATINNTWTFYFLGYPKANLTYEESFTDESRWMLTQGTNNENTALLGDEVGVDLMTSAYYYPSFPCLEYVLNYEYIYVNFTWLLIHNPGRTPTYNATTHPITSDPFITGITSYSQSIPILCLGP